MYRVNPMPTQQNTTLPLGLPTSEKDMTRPVCGCLIFCDSLCAWMKVSTPRSMLSALDGRSSGTGSLCSAFLLASASAALTLERRSTPPVRSGWDQRFRFVVSELDRGESAWTLVSSDCRTTAWSGFDASRFEPRRALPMDLVEGSVPMAIEARRGDASEDLAEPDWLDGRSSSRDLTTNE
jgi:hypothetical protein